MRNATKAIAVFLVFALLIAAAVVMVNRDPGPPAPSPVVNTPEVAKQQPAPADQRTGKPAQDAQDEASDPVAPAPQENLQRMPVRWLTEPLDLPPEGIPFELRQWPGGETLKGGTVHKDHVVFEMLPDGNYTWVDIPDISPGTELRGGSSKITVKTYEVSIQVSRRGDSSLFLPLFYTVPVRLLANLPGRAEMDCAIECAPTGEHGPYFRETVKLRHRQVQSVRVPRGKLTFSDAAGGIVAHSNVVSSIGDRLPEPDELIELRPALSGELVVAVSNQPTGWLESAIRLYDGSTTDLATCYATVRVEGWSTERGETTRRSSRPLSEQVSGAGASLALDELSFLITPLEQDKTIFISLKLTNNLIDLSKRMDRTIAVGEARLIAEQGWYRVELNPIQWIGEVTVSVTDKNDVPRPFQPVNAGAFFMARGEQQALGGGTGRTNAEGKIVYRGVGIVPGGGFVAECRGHRAQALFRPGDTTLQLRITLDAREVQPLVFEFVTDDLSPEEVARIQPKPAAGGIGIRMRSLDSEVKYSITTTARNSNMSKSGKEFLEDDWLLVSNFVEPGPFTAVLETAFGQYVVTGDHDRLASEPVKVRLEPSTQVVTVCIDSEGSPMERAVFWTNPQDPREDWARAGDLVRDYDPWIGRGRPITDAFGKATIWCRTSRADPATWGYYHPDHGLMRAAQADATGESTFRVTLVPREAGTATVIVKAPRAKGQCRIVLRLYGPEDIFDARTNLGAVKPLEGEEVVFRGVPPGSYEIKLFEFVERGIISPPKENCIRIEVTAGATQVITLPLKE